ncbi:MAG: Phage integrase, N-terminal SAM-like domain [Thermoplasmata archaeon]|nr:Phage integrase, N-terminal SAM-like domain [Thermoplasmata archaeon]
MANWRKTKTPGVYVAHQVRCPAFNDDDPRCRCEPSWRGRRRHPVTGKAEWQKPVTKNRSEVLSWLGIWKKGASHAREQAKTSRTFESIGDEWLNGVKAGRISRRKGRSKPYSPTTLRDYASAYRNFLRPEFGPFPADDIGEVEWQMWCDSALLRMRCHSGLTSAAPRVRLVTTSAGAYTSSPVSAPTPAPTPSIAAPSTAPDAAPNAAPHTSASSNRPVRLRLRRSALPMMGSIAAPPSPAMTPQASPSSRTSSRPLPALVASPDAVPMLQIARSVILAPDFRLDGGLPVPEAGRQAWLPFRERRPPWPGRFRRSCAWAAAPRGLASADHGCRGR